MKKSILFRSLISELFILVFFCVVLVCISIAGYEQQRKECVWFEMKLELNVRLSVCYTKLDLTVPLNG